MPLIHNRGSKDSKLWIVMERPYNSDEPRGYLLSGGMGHVVEKMFKEAKLDLNTAYCCSRRPDTDTPSGCLTLENELNHYKPPFIIVMGEAGRYFLPALRSKELDKWKGQLAKNAGSLLQSAMLQYPHYMMPMYAPDRLVADWRERNVSTYVDLQKLRDELLHWQKHGTLQTLPERKLIYGNLDLDEILLYLERFMHAKLLSNDIETAYPRTVGGKKSAYDLHPGYPITVGLADSPDFGISFNLFRDKPSENRKLWRTLEKLIWEVPQLGQNFFSFDALFYEMLGFRIDLTRVKDTLLRHHILWPELSHKLQFMTRQYTREPYYKDEGHGWSIKNMDKLRRYNCLDVCVTMEIFLQQELEFKQKPHLA